MSFHNREYEISLLGFCNRNLSNSVFKNKHSKLQVHRTFFSNSSFVLASVGNNHMLGLREIFV